MSHDDNDTQEAYCCRGQQTRLRLCAQLRTSERSQPERAWPSNRRKEALASSGNKTPVRCSAFIVSASVAPGLNTLAGERAKRRRSFSREEMEREKEIGEGSKSEFTAQWANNIPVMTFVAGAIPGPPCCGKRRLLFYYFSVQKYATFDVQIRIFLF